MNTQATLLIQSLGWGILHSLWQVLLIYCCLRLALKAVGNASAVIKYRLSVAALGGSFGWFVYTCFNQWQKLQGVTIHVTQSGADPAATKSYSLTTLPSASSGGEFMSGLAQGIEPYLPVLVSLYAAGVVLLIVRFAVNLRQTVSLRRNGLQEVNKLWNDWLLQWQDKLEINRKVRLYISGKINVPVTLGTLRPVILLPIACMNGLSTEQIESILLHELAHIKRHDYLLNILQTIAETILFFNPLIWAISRIIRKEREHCCDDAVLGQMQHPLAYAKALASLESYRVNNSLALAAGKNKHQLLNRIKRIMEMNRKPMNYTQAGIAALLIVVLLASVAWFSPGMAQTMKVVTKDKNGTKTTTVTTDSKQKKNGTTVVSKSVIIERSDDVNKDGVHPQDVGNEEHVNKMMKEAMQDVDRNPINKGVQIAIKDIDGEKIAKEVKVAIDGVDWAQIGKDVSLAINGVNWTEISDELAKAGKEMADVNWEEIRAEVSDALHDPKMKKELQIAMKEARDAHAVARVHIMDARRDMEDARKEMEEARREMHRGRADETTYSYKTKDFNEMLEEMEDDGLININKGYSVRKKDGALYIDGKKQPASVQNKYNKYIGDADEVSIKGSKGNMNISVSSSK